MRSRALLGLIAGAIFFVPATANAVSIHVHEKVPVHHQAVVGKDVDNGAPKIHEWTTTKTVVRVEHVAPVDEDQDGIADSKDDCVFCAPDPVEETYTDSSGYTEPTESYSDVTSSGGGCTGMEAESGTAGYSAYNPSSGAAGCYQIIPSTAANYGCDLSTPGGQDACMVEICGSEGNGAWASSGATPCG